MHSYLLGDFLTLLRTGLIAFAGGGSLLYRLAYCLNPAREEVGKPAKHCFGGCTYGALNHVVWW